MQLTSLKNNPVLGAFEQLIPQLSQTIAEIGYQNPTPIQTQAIPILLEGKDLIGCAQTGTGKTAAFVLPILQHLNHTNIKPFPRKPRVLILAPTRELSAQIGESISTYGKYLQISHSVIYGGVSQNPQVSKLRSGIDILVATPGRLQDLMNQNHVHLDKVEIFVLDEADRMLDMGFIIDIKKIIEKLPAKRQSLFFSATIESEVLDLAHTLVHDAVHVSVNPDQPTVEKIIQKVYFVDRQDKDPLLASLLKKFNWNRVLVFTQMKHTADVVVSKLQKLHINAAVIHGNKSQKARTDALYKFKQGHLQVLVATDIAARGIDVESISHVVNYNIPITPDVYIHRIGRTARAGADGDAISFCCATERDYLRSIEKRIRKAVPVDKDHPFHSEAAFRATGADAKPNLQRQKRVGAKRSDSSKVVQISSRTSRTNLRHRSKKKASFTNYQ